tara:strand:- start:58 stop:2283 length:2226 start_codon:yes stop_codon:yes gene_type:complete
MNNKAIQLAGLSPFKQEDDIPEYIDAPFVDGMQAKYDKMYRQQDDRTLSLNTFDVTTEKGMIDYLKHTENSIKAGYDAKKDRWFPHDDGEGNWTIGYGHHIASHMKDTGYTIEELKKKGLSSKEVEDLLRYDIKRESKLIAENVDGWEDMSTLQKNALLDIQFNIRGNVWTKFKNFTKAIQNKDWINVVMHGSRQEYGNKPNQRNTAFYKSMIEPLMNEWRPQIKNPDYKAPKETEQNNPWWRFGIPDNNAQQLKTEGSLLKLKDPYTGEKMFESPIKSTTVNPTSGLSPFKDTEDAVIDYNISLNEAGLSPDPGQDITDLYSEDFLNTFAYFDQQYTDGKLFRRLSGEEITEHDMYIGGTEEYSSYDERIASEQEMFKNNFGSGYSDISQTIERIKERMKNNKVFGTKNDDEIYEFFQFLHKLNERGIDYKDYTLDDLVVMKDTGRDLRELYKAQKVGDGKGGSHADVGGGEHGSKYQGDHADIILSYEQARSWIKDNNVKSIEDFKELLNKEMSAVYAHELAHASGLGFGIEGVEIIWRNAGDPILSDRDGEKIGEYKSSGYYAKTPDGVNSNLIYDSHYALAKGQMSERDFRIINRLLFRSDSPYGARADYRTGSHDRSVFEVYADMMAFRITALNEGIYDWRTEDLTREKLLEFIKFYEGEGKQMPLMAKRFIDKMMVAPDSSFREDQSDEEYEKRKYDNLIYMNNVIALGNDSFSDPSNISDPMRINSGTGLDRRV